MQLLDNILLWGSILSTPCLKDLALDSTLNRYILSALQTTDTAEENIHKCQKVANKLTRPALSDTGEVKKETEIKDGTNFPSPGGSVFANALVLRAQGPADAAAAGALVPLPHPPGQHTAPQQYGDV